MIPSSFPASLADLLWRRWSQVRRMSYDYLELLKPEHLSLRMPFPGSRSIGDQFWCMIGAQESFLRELETGAWQKFSCSLDQFEAVTIQAIKQQLDASDEKFERLLKKVDLASPKAGGGYAYNVIFTMIEHEIYHQGQLMTLMFFHRLPIPRSWQERWALSYEEPDG